MTSREQFEAWFQQKYKVTADTMKVMQIKVELAWESWQASRAAVEIKLPNQACLATWHYAGSAPDDFYEDIEISRKPSEDKSVDGTEPFPLLTKWEVEQAIESAGLKVKGD